MGVLDKAITPAYLASTQARCQQVYDQYKAPSKLDPAVAGVYADSNHVQYMGLDSAYELQLKLSREIDNAVKQAAQTLKGMKEPKITEPPASVFAYNKIAPPAFLFDFVVRYVRVYGYVPPALDPQSLKKAIVIEWVTQVVD